MIINKNYFDFCLNDREKKKHETTMLEIPYDVNMNIGLSG